ncbi:hypothetical protein HDU83_000715 [Entophlyctis luteolus]|nr:hypothetical protein HDU83_000715 [Entophlyctis luteolus]
MDDIDATETASQFSEAPSSAVSTQLFTCLACHVAFRSADNQRDHYRSDWHRYNLKRKVAELQPVSMENFAMRLQQQAAKASTDAVRSTYSEICHVCQLSQSFFAGKGTHLVEILEAVTAAESKKGLKIISKAATPNQQQRQQLPDPNEKIDEEDGNEAQTPSGSGAPKTNWRIAIGQAQTEDSLNAVLDAKIAAAQRLDPKSDCLFCHAHKSASLEENMGHMAAAHSFFVPDLEFLVDLEGLVRYLGEKISIGNVCLYCNGRGRTLHSLEAVRGHMIDKGHCKIDYENGGEQEVAEFYDFSSTWDDAESDSDWVDEDGDEVTGEDKTFTGVSASGNSSNMVMVNQQQEMKLIQSHLNRQTPTISEDGRHLILASGRKLIHRHVHTIRTPKTPLPESLAITRAVAANYASLDAVAVRSRIAQRAVEREAVKQNAQVARGYAEFRVRVGMRANKSTANQHFRSQIGFD